MSKYLFWAVALTVLPAAAAAQHGTVYYDQSTATDFELPDEVKDMEGIEDLLAQFPTHQAQRHLLIFDATASLMYEDTAHRDSIMASFDPMKLMEDLGPEKMMEIGMAFMNSISTDDMDFAAAMPPKDTYVNFDEGTYTQERLVLDRTFRVTGELELPSWRMSGEERSFLGHRILKATAMQDSVDVEAWFTPEIPVPAGPALYGGLPGLILVISLDGGKQTYTATKLDLENALEVIRPSEGREVTVEEFSQIVEEKNKEFRESLSRIRNQGFGF